MESLERLASLATRSAVGYYRETNGLTGERFKFVGCYVHYDGYQVHRDIYRRFGTNTEAIKNWINEGIAGGGYRNALGAEPYGTRPNPVFTTDTGFDYFWLLNEETGLLECLLVRGLEEGYTPPELVNYTPLPLVDDEAQES